MAMLWSNSAQAGWFTSDDNKQQQIDRLNHQLDEEQHSNGQMQVVIIILGVGCVATLIVGAAIGSKARRAANEQRE
jgi:hypothetical protein